MEFREMIGVLVEKQVLTMKLLKKVLWKDMN